jgi:hypothetical protein
MSSPGHNQQNNWAYILLLVIVTFTATVGILNYARNTIQEIDNLSERTVNLEK